MAMIYLSPNPYFDAFEETIDIRRFDLSKHRLAGLCLTEHDGRLFLGGISPSTPAAKIPRWHTQIKGAWLIKVGTAVITSIDEVHEAFPQHVISGNDSVTLLFSHPEIQPDISHDGLPIISSTPFHQHVHDQLNNRWDFSTVAEHLRKAPPYSLVDNGGILNVVTKVMKLTRRKLLQQSNWNNWQASKFLQLNQYDAQRMFGLPVFESEGDAIFHLVWTYNIKVVNGRKKARCVCDSSTRSGQVLDLAETYANCVDQTSACLFYAVASAKNLLIFRADVSNAFAEAPPPKQPFFICPDTAFCEWWTKHLKRIPIQPGQIIPVLSTMQDHPESSRLWEKHADQILQEIGLKPTVHEPCLYSGTFDGNRALLMHQVDDFAVAAPDSHMANILMDLIDKKISIQIKRQGYLDMYNGVDVLQTKHYIRINVKTFIEKAFEQHIATWMKTSYPIPNRSTPLPSSDQDWIKKLNVAIGNPDAKIQAQLAKKH
jgi:hypothetical protein